MVNSHIMFLMLLYKQKHVTGPCKFSLMTLYKQQEFDKGIFKKEKLCK